MRSRKILVESMASKKQPATRPESRLASQRPMSRMVTTRASTRADTSTNSFNRQRKSLGETFMPRRTGDQNNFKVPRINFNVKTMDVKFVLDSSKNSRTKNSVRAETPSKSIETASKTGYCATTNKFAIKVNIRRAGKSLSITGQDVTDSEANRSKSAYQNDSILRFKTQDKKGLTNAAKTLHSESGFPKQEYLNLATIIRDEEIVIDQNSKKINRPEEIEKAENSKRQKYRKTAPVRSFLKSTTNNLAEKIMKASDQPTEKDQEEKLEDDTFQPFKECQDTIEERCIEENTGRAENTDQSRSVKIEEIERHRNYSDISNFSRIVDTSFYENYPIELASKLHRDPNYNYSSRPAEFLDKYSKTLDNFIYEYLVRDDGMLNSLVTGQPYRTETQKKVHEEMKAMAREAKFSETGILFDMRVGVGDGAFISQNKPLQNFNPDKYTKMAEEEFQKVYAEIKEVEAVTGKIKNGIHFNVDLRTNMPRYKSNLLPNEVEEIEAFFNDHRFGEEPTDSEIEKIGDIVKNLIFFKKIDKECRHLLLRGAILRKYKPGDFVVQQGEAGNSMFIILSGAANVLINGIHPKTKLPHKFRVACLPDGSSFGEYSLLSFPSPPQGGTTIYNAINDLKSTLNPKGIKKVLEIMKRERELEQTADKLKAEEIGKANLKMLIEDRKKENYKELVTSMKPPFVPNTRAASIQVYETSLMLEVSANLFKTAIVDNIRKEMIDKIRILSLQIFFSNHAGINFVPIAMLMKKVEYKFGQVIIKSGGTPDSLLIIKSGFVEVVSVMKRSREVNSGIYSHANRVPLRNMNFQYKMNHAIDINAKKERDNLEQEQQAMLEHKRRANIKSDRLFAFDPVNEEDSTSNTRQYYDFFLSKRLCQGDCLFTRCLYSKDIGGDGYLIEGQDAGIEKSKLTVIAASSTVVCYELKKNNIVFIPEPTKSILLRECQKLVDHDIEVTDTAVGCMSHWDDYKEHVYINQLLLRQLSKKEDAYKKY